MAINLSAYMPYKFNEVIVNPIITDDPTFQEVCSIVVVGVPNGQYDLTASWIFSLPDRNDAMIWRFVIDGVISNTFQIEESDVSNQRGWAYVLPWTITTGGVSVTLEARVDTGGLDASVIAAFISVARRPLAP
jgi:hypothetical protein